MTISIATYQVRCDEPGCYNTMHFIAGVDPHYTGLYEITPERVGITYRFWEGEVTPDGKHRCKACRIRLGTFAERTPNEITETLAEGWRMDKESRLSALAAVVRAARRYRGAEQDGTPRLWRGKDLQKIASALDNALEVLDGTEQTSTNQQQIGNDRSDGDVVSGDC